MKNPFRSVLNSFRDLPDKKKYIEVITATLSIPVLLSVVFMNYISIQEKRNTDLLTPAPIISEAPKDASPTIITIIRDSDPTPTPAENGPTAPPAITTAACIKEIGPISISSPDEGSTVRSPQLNITVDYDQGDYCSVVWSYRINDASWSEFGDNDIVIYNLFSGQKTVELRVKSLASAATKTIKRSFTYINPSEAATPTTSPSPTPVI